MLTHGLRVEAFTSFVEEAGGRLEHALVAGFGRDRGAEAAAEALAYAWEHWDRIQQMTNPAGYLYAVGRDRARRAGRRRTPFGDAAPIRDREPWVEPELAAAIDGLSERQRIAVLLVHGDEWTLSEVADLLGIDRGSVKQHLNRGMAKLQRRLRGGES